MHLLEKPVNPSSSSVSRWKNIQFGDMIDICSITTKKMDHCGEKQTFFLLGAQTDQ